MPGSIYEAQRHSSNYLNPQSSSRSSASSTLSSRALCRRNGWDKEEELMAERLRGLPERLASLESLRELST
ncbi:hypothetical protein [Phormidium sp. CCY1219]|uniref:hypothetical protein n=1 Tax=Phormidium sp. CCY1219 TaxID=2886104 RepID=UPI002D1F3943|nr:hypothetical protein [Phormidium sp. CCY1219]MEB3830629.1 hypothetical protein [Phormidium sp. CCY1219]